MWCAPLDPVGWRNTSSTHNVPWLSVAVPTPIWVYADDKMFSRCGAEFMNALCTWLSLDPSPTFSPMDRQQQTSEPSDELWYSDPLLAIACACRCATDVRSDATLSPDRPWLARALLVSETNAPAELA